MIPGRYRVLLGQTGAVMPLWYPGSQEPDGAVPVEVTSGLNELEPVVMRSVGGLRASIYNAFPEAGVDALVQFMQEFERKNG